jgi:hypothetical protein
MDGAGRCRKHAACGKVPVLEDHRFMTRRWLRTVFYRRCEKVDWNKQEIEPGTLSRPHYHQGAEVDIHGDDLLVEMSRAPESKSRTRLHNLEQDHRDQHYDGNPARRGR